MAKFNIKHCPVCDSTNFTSFLTCTDFFVSNEKFSIKSCASCGFKLTENSEDEEHIGPYYQSEEYISHSNTSKGLVNSAYHFVRKYMLARKRKLVENYTQLRTGRILDVGTGTGFFLNEMQQYGWQVDGVEKSADARSFAKQEFKLIINNTEELFSLKKASFDAISLWHVLEHIHQVDKNMKAFVNLLKDSGKLFVAVPNHTSYDAKHYKEYWAAWDVPRHIWHFSPAQMQRFGEKYQLRLIGIKTMPFDSFYVSMLSEKYKKSSLAFVKGLLHGKISWLKSLLHPKSASSLIYIFEKM